MSSTTLKPGDRAPDFKALLHDGTEISSADLKGRRTILYFYPKDNTPGCTTEACDFRDNYARLAEQLGVQVIGVSPDGAASHVKFKAKFDLPFPLISDPDHAVAQAFGVWREKKLYSWISLGIVRSTFVIGPDGTIEKAHYGVKATGHVDRLLAELG